MRATPVTSKAASSQQKASGSEMCSRRQGPWESLAGQHPFLRVRGHSFMLTIRETRASFFLAPGRWFSSCSAPQHNPEQPKSCINLHQLVLVPKGWFRNSTSVQGVGEGPFPPMVLPVLTENSWSSASPPHSDTCQA